MINSYDLVIYIGRFQPLHDGHTKTIDAALICSRKVLVLVGSSYTSRSIKNPFTYGERNLMIRRKFKHEYNVARSLDIKPLVDVIYNDTSWVNQVRIAAKESLPEGGRIAIIGHEKDDSSYYLKMFPNWSFITASPESWGDSTKHLISATDIRDCIFGESTPTCNAMAKCVIHALNAFSDNRAFSILTDEYQYIQDYKKSWENSPFPPSFNCSDAIVVQSGHILMVKRGGMPGKGTYAIPGGFIDKGEGTLDAAIRELREETRLKVPEKVLRGSIFARHVFDHPERSLRGRTYSHAFGFKLDDSMALPEVRGSDDAIAAEWIPIETFKSNEFKSNVFEDHASIIEYFLGYL